MCFSTNSGSNFASLFSLRVDNDFGGLLDGTFRRTMIVFISKMLIYQYGCEVVLQIAQLKGSGFHHAVSRTN